MKRTAIAVVAVYVAVSIYDYVLHGVLLTSLYASSAQLWRPMAEYRMGLGMIVTLVSAACFVLVYSQFIAGKSLKTALLYGLILGVGQGMSMGYGSYAVMPIPYMLALAWFLGSIGHNLLAGAVTGWIVQDSQA